MAHHTTNTPTHLELHLKGLPLGVRGLPHHPKSDAFMLGLVVLEHGGKDPPIEVGVPCFDVFELGIIHGGEELGTKGRSDEGGGLGEVGGDPLKGAFLGALGHMEAHVLGHNLGV